MHSVPAARSGPPPADLLATAVAAARAAVTVHVAHRGGVGQGAWDRKRASDFVTFVDREAEQEVLRAIRAAHPHDDVLAEEGTTGTLLADADAPDPHAALRAHPGPLWVIDPLDGTTNYLHGYRAYAASVAVCFAGEAAAGAVIDGYTGEVWSASRGGGASLDGLPLAVSTIDSLDNALIGTGFPFKTPDRIGEQLRMLDAALRHTSGVRRAGSAALDLCHVAAGYFDGFFELELAPWDIAAGVLIVREAGGTITDLSDRVPVTGERGVLAGNGPIHRLLGELMRSL